MVFAVGAGNDYANGHSGQSMENATAEIKAADHPDMRVWFVPSIKKNVVALRGDSCLTVFGRESHASCAWHCGGACACAQPPGLEGETRGARRGHCERLTAATYSVTIVLSLRLKSKSACGLFWGW